MTVPTCEAEAKLQVVEVSPGTDSLRTALVLLNARLTGQQFVAKGLAILPALHLVVMVARYGLTEFS